MKFELKDYQEDAAVRVLSGLRKGSKEYADDQEFTAVSLSAPTGAGKTVIAAAVIERILFGDVDGAFDEDPDAVFIWLTDDPSLNEQTRKKLLEASDRLQSSHLVSLDDGFDQPELDRGRVYFLNIQKLGKNSNLVTKKEGKRKHVMWDTISQTIKKNGAHFYLIIDEAHRGTGKRSNDATTIVHRMMNGDGVVLPAPVVLGISATPQRFDEAVKSGSTARTARKVEVPVASVRESGLIKDVLSITYRDEDQAMESTLVRQAVANLRAMHEAWDEYTKAEDQPDVIPALVLQIPPGAKDSDVGDLIDVCIKEWSELGHTGAIAHSLESHGVQVFGNHSVRYVAPQMIQDRSAIRMIIFKEALTTGWDCPRAEVMVSLRSAKDDTYIAQLIGRMVRSPLARRIESDESLNRVRLYLPLFDKDAVEGVKARLESDDGGIATDIETYVVDAPRNKALPDDVFPFIESLPSYQVPGPVHRSQVSRLHKLATLLSGDELLEDAISQADEFLVSVIESERTRLKGLGKLDALVKDARTASVEVMDIHADGEVTTTSEDFDADDADLDFMFKKTKRRFRDGLADTYWKHRIGVLGEEIDEAKIMTIALGLDSSVVEAVEEQASQRVRQWLDDFGDAIINLSADKQARYGEVRAMARKPEQVHPVLPTGPINMSNADDLPKFAGHLYADAKGDFRTRLGSWEKHVYDVESARAGFVAWYRNPTGGQRSLRVPYETGTGYKPVYPDFVVIHRNDNDELQASIVDPHGHHLADAADKLRGLAEYAKDHKNDFARIIGVIKNDAGEFRMLDLTDDTIRTALEKAQGKDGIAKIFADHGAAYS